MDGTWGSESSWSSQLPLKFSSKQRCCYGNTSVFWASCQISADFAITLNGRYWAISFVLVQILKHFRIRVRCSKLHLWGHFPLTLSVQSEPLRLSHHECFYVDLMFVNLWNKHPAWRALAADFLISADMSYPRPTRGVDISVCFKISVSLCVINFCSLLWITGLFPQQVVSDIG